MNKLDTFKISQLDLEQMSETALSQLAAELLVTFSAQKKSDHKSFWDKVVNLNDYFAYKFYRYKGEGYLSTNNPQISKSSLKLTQTSDFKFQNIRQLDSDIIIEGDYFKADGKYYRLVSLLEMPSEIDYSDLDSFGDYCVFFRPISRQMSQNKLKALRNSHYSSLVSSGPKDLEGELSHNDSEEMLSELIQGLQSMFRVEVFFIIEASTQESLHQKTQHLLKDLKVAGAKPFVESHSLFHLIDGVMSENMPKFLRGMDKNSDYLFNLLPLQSDFLMDEGVCFRAISGAEVNFSLFNLDSTNFNLLVSGESGSGKSMLVQKIVKEEFERGSSVLILDLGNSFKKLAGYFDAREFSKTFNPLAFKNAHYLKEFCLAFVDSGEISKKDEGVIYKTISESLSENSDISFKKLLSRIDSKIAGFSLYFEEYQEYFDDESFIVGDEAEFVYVDTQAYPEKLKRGLVLYLFEYFKNFNDGEKLFVIDEAWSFLANSAEYISECFRTFRKYKASAIAISQGIKDFYSNDLGQSIFNNSFYKILFKQNTKELSMLDDEDKKRIDSIKSIKGSFSQFYLKSDQHRKVINYVPSSSEYELFTSNRDDNLKIEKFFEVNCDYFGFRETFNRWVKFKYEFQGCIQ